MRPTHIPNPHKLRALLVYSHRPTADALAELFAVCGQDVMVAYEKTTACGLARWHRPNVVFLDLRSHGEEMACWMREQSELQDTALVAITAPDGEAALCATAHCFAHYLVEPVDPIQVQALLKKLKTPR
jgi:CheY-like chemotaxis protein